MEVAQVLHMNGGVGDASYANNSLVQVYLQTTYHKKSNKHKFD